MGHSHTTFIVTLKWLTPLSLLLSQIALAQDADIPVRDMGVREIGQTYPLKLTAKNIDCDTAQDFEFEIENMPWLNTPGEPIVRALGPAQSRTIQSEMDFQYTEPGVYYGRITSRCITCGWYIFASCIDKGQDVVMKLTVMDPVSGKKPPNARNPYAGLKPDIRYAIKMVEPVSDDLKTHLDTGSKKGQKQALNGARATVEKAERNGKDAQKKLRTAQRKKADCERKLARLKSDAANAKRKAETTQTASKAAAASAKKAAKALKNFEKDNKRALTKIKNSGDAVIAQKQVLKWAERDNGVDSQAYRNAEGFLKEAQDKHIQTLKDHSAVSGSLEQRQKTAAETALAAEKAKSQIEATEKAAKAAKYAYEQQIKICKINAKAVETAQDNVETAKEIATNAVKGRNKAEIKAAGQAATNLNKAISQRENECKALQKSHQDEIKGLERAIKAGAKIGMLDKKGGASSAKKLREINDKLWKKAKETAEQPIDVGEAVAQHVSKVSDMGASTILAGLQGLAIGVQGLYATLNNPNTKFAQERPQVKINELREKGYKDAESLMKTIEALRNDRNYLDKRVERYKTQAARCYGDVMALKAKEAEAKRLSRQ